MRRQRSFVVLGLEEMAVFELPFLFPTPEAAYGVLDGPIGQELLDKLADNARRLFRHRLPPVLMRPTPRSTIDWSGKISSCERIWSRCNRTWPACNPKIWS